jgi:ubiquinol-cytochrome c reductase core subunit 2
MLPSNGQRLAKSLQKSFQVASRSFGVAASAPLTDPLEDEVVAPKKEIQKDLKVSTLDNGITVASVDTGGPVSRLVLAIKAGSRYEAKNQLGAAHLAKNAAFITNGGRSQLRTVRETQQIGGSLEAGSSRELMTRTGKFLRGNLPGVMENMVPGIITPTFAPWDFDQAKKMCAGDLATMDNTGSNIEELHKAAFRDGLGNSLYVNGAKMGSHSSDSVGAYISQHAVGGGVTVVGTDVDHDELVRYSADLLGGLPSTSPATGAHKYHGGEIHLNNSTGFAYASLVGEGAGLTSDDLATFTILQRILGYGTSIKWGSNTGASRLNRAALKATSDPHSISALNVSYSDAGLFGFHVVASPASIRAVLESAIEEVAGIPNGSISAEEVEQAKNQMKSNAYMFNEGADDVIDDLVRQIALTGGYASPAEMVKKIDGVTVESVIEVAQKVFSGNASLAVSGDSSFAPYLDELL